MGGNEKLIRAISGTYDKKSTTSLDHYRNTLENLKLSKCEDLSSYFAMQEELHTRMEKHGDEEKMSESLKRFYIYKGLPSEYDPAKQALRLPGSNYSWEDIKDYLLEFCTRNANVPGKARSKGGKNDGHVYNATDTSQEACRNFARGKCTKGSKCKHSHAAKPPKASASGGGGNSNKSSSGNDKQQGPKCHSCSKHGHVAKDCEVPCDFCGERGHNDKQCFKRKRAKEQYKDHVDRTHSTSSSSSKANDASAPPGGAPSAVNASYVSLYDFNFTFAAYESTLQDHFPDIEVEPDAGKSFEAKCEAHTQQLNKLRNLSLEEILDSSWMLDTENQAVGEGREPREFYSRDHETPYGEPGPPHRRPGQGQACRRE